MAESTVAQNFIFFPIYSRVGFAVHTRISKHHDSIIEFRFMYIDRAAEALK